MGYGHVYMLETNVSGCMSDTNSLQVAIGSVGINSISDNESISIYPQPAIEKLFINLLSNNYNLLQIADLKGNVLIEQDICSEKEVVYIESLSSGVYILLISNQFERVVKKFVKMWCCSITSGNLRFTQPSSGMILKSPDGNCWKVTVDNTGNLTSVQVECEE